MLRHFSDPAVATAARISINALNVQPEGLLEQFGLQWRIARENPHGFYSVLILKEHLEILVLHPSLQGFHIPLILFSKDGLGDEEIGQGVWEHVNLEADCIAA